MKGTFTPTSRAATLSSAPHFNNPSTPIIARFSNSTGIPKIPDSDPNGNPRGLAVRFQLAETPRRVHTDILSHSTPFFPARTGEEFLQFFQAIGAGKVPEFLEAHPKTLAFVQAHKGFASSFAREKFFGVNAYKFIAADGTERFVRYRFVPEAGEDYLDEATLKEKEPNFLFDQVPALVAEGPVRFRLLAQVAGEGDATDDAQAQWPAERELVDLGRVELDRLVDDDAEEQRKIIFDPIPRVQGVEPSDDPLLDIRAATYLLSGRERRAAPAVTA